MRLSKVKSNAGVKTKKFLDMNKNFTESNIKSVGMWNELLNIQAELENALVHKPIDWEKAKAIYDRLDHKISDWASKLAAGSYYSRQDFENFVKGLYQVHGKNNSLEYYWQELKKNKELMKFRNGDFKAKIGTGNGREYGFSKKICSLCEFKSECFTFDDNEDYQKEALCKNCIETIIKYWPQ